MGAESSRRAVRVTSECMGVGNCAQIAPELFHLGEDGYSKVAEVAWTGETLDLARRAALNCPTGAIEIEEI